jgi:hypothetical protein
MNCSITLQFNKKG